MMIQGCISSGMHLLPLNCLQGISVMKKLMILIIPSLFVLGCSSGPEVDCKKAMVSENFAGMLYLKELTKGLGDEEQQEVFLKAAECAK